MSEERKIDPEDSRKYLVEAVRIAGAPGNTNIVVKKEHVRALYEAWMAECQKAIKTRNLISKLAEAARKGKLPSAKDLPFFFAGIAEAAPAEKPTQEKN